jgi:hypothetical protein
MRITSALSGSKAFTPTVPPTPRCKVISTPTASPPWDALAITATPPWVYTNLLGYAQDFAGGSHSNLTVIASTNGAFEINNLHGLWSYYFTNNGLAAFGAPLDNEFASSNGTRQDFSQGFLSWDPVSQIVWHQARPVLTLGSNGVLGWSGAFTLQSATNVSGPYLDETGATSPYTSTIGTLPRQFFRLRN